MSDAYVGEIRLFAGSFAPEDWAVCDGSLLSINSFQALYALIGVTWGGDGKTTFAVPDLRGRVPLGQGQKPGLTARTMCQTGGAETVTLTAATMPSHNHPVAAATAEATAAKPAGNGLATAAATHGYYVPAGSDDPVNASVLNALTIGNDGGNLPHANLMPSMALTYIIATNGLFPERQ